MMKAKALVVAAGLAFSVGGAWAQQVGHDGGMPVLTGELWQQMSQSEKMAFVWGVAHVVDFERNVRAQDGGADGKTLIPHIEEALEGRTFRSVVEEIDDYYAGSSGREDRPVLSALVIEGQ